MSAFVTWSVDSCEVPVNRATNTFRTMDLEQLQDARAHLRPIARRARRRRRTCRHRASSSLTRLRSSLQLPYGRGELVDVFRDRNVPVAGVVAGIHDLQTRSLNLSPRLAGIVGKFSGLRGLPLKLGLDLSDRAPIETNSPSTLALVDAMSVLARSVATWRAPSRPELPPLHCHPA